MMNEQNLFTAIPVPARLPKIVIPVDARREIIDYFAVLATQHDATSYDGSRIQYILRSLEKADDPIEDILATARQQRLPYQQDIYELYQVALEMLYAVRHQLEAKLIQGQLPAHPNRP